MFYYARIDAVTKVCIQVVQDENFITGDENLILIDSYDTTMVGRKKYVDYQWVDTTPDEGALYDAHATKCHSKWLDEMTGDTDDLDTTDKTSLVNAINECFQYASNGKTAIANAIAGVDDSLAIPTDPTFAQLAALIGQLGGMQMASGSVSEFTTPASIASETAFKPKLVIIYNYGTGITNVNIGVYVSSELMGSGNQISDSVYGLGGTLSRYANPFTISDTGFSFSNHGAATNLKWIALG